MPELAERIKSLKAAQTIEATPQRSQQKASSAEEPITARIRRRTQAASTSEPATDSKTTASPPEVSLPPETTFPVNPENHTSFDHSSKAGGSSIKPMTFQERVTRGRRRDEGQEIGM